MDILVLGFLTAVAFILVMNKIGLGKFIRFNAASDLLISGIITMLFVGTFTGMATGLVAGIVISIFLSVMKKMKKMKKEWAGG